MMTAAINELFERTTFFEASTFTQILLVRLVSVSDLNVLSVLFQLN